MKNIILLLLLMVGFISNAQNNKEHKEYYDDGTLKETGHFDKDQQKDTLYFNSAWNKTTKANATFFRPLPLKKVGNLYQIKDCHINGNLQMEGFKLISVETPNAKIK